MKSRGLSYFLTAPLHGKMLPVSFKAVLTELEWRDIKVGEDFIGNEKHHQNISRCKGAG